MVWFRYRIFLNRFRSSFTFLWLRLDTCSSDFDWWSWCHFVFYFCKRRIVFNTLCSLFLVALKILYDNSSKTHAYFFSLNGLCLKFHLAHSHTIGCYPILCSSGYWHDWFYPWILSLNLSALLLEIFKTCMIPYCKIIRLNFWMVIDFLFRNVFNLLRSSWWHQSFSFNLWNLPLTDWHLKFIFSVNFWS